MTIRQFEDNGKTTERSLPPHLHTQGVVEQSKERKTIIRPLWDNTKIMERK